MTLIEIFTDLCSYDPRNPFNNIEDNDSPRNIERTDKCYCDNCFYGRDRLALEILRLKELTDKKIEVY
jgi:hypothetical protein